MTTNPAAETLPNGLPKIQRFITAHDDSGKSIYNKEIPEDGAWTSFGNVAELFLNYTTQTFPVSFKPTDATNPKSGADDIVKYEELVRNPPSIALPNGTVVRHLDIAPNSTPVMHRTQSIDFGVVVEGVMESILDSGEVRIMRRGDSIVQRATSHAWKNVTPDNGWARMYFVLLASESPVVDGKELEEDLSGYAKAAEEAGQ